MPLIVFNVIIDKTLANVKQKKQKTAKFSESFLRTAIKLYPIRFFSAVCRFSHGVFDAGFAIQ